MLYHPLRRFSAAADRNEFYDRVLAIPALKCPFMPTAEIALTADLVCSRARSPFFSTARCMLPPRLKSFEDFQFSVLRLLIIRVRRTQVVSFAAGAAPASVDPRSSSSAPPSVTTISRDGGIEGPFVNSPNAWLRLRCLVARPPRRAFFMILLD